MADLGLSIGIGLTTRWLLSFLTPRPEGAKADDLKAPKSEYGAGIARIYGKGRVGGNLMWAEDIREEKEGKGGGGGGKGYEYFGTFALLLADHIEGYPYTLNQIWLNGDLVYDPSSDDAETVDSSTKWANNHLTFYDGSQTTKNSLIEAKEGTENTPVFKNKCYAVISDLPLEPYGNRYPSVGVAIESGLTDLGGVVTDICKESGLVAAEVNTTEITGTTITGLTVAQDGESYRQSIEQLQQVYLFYAADIDNVLYFRTMQRASAIASIPLADMGAMEYGGERDEAFYETRTESLELPTELSLSFNNPDLDYDKDKQLALRKAKINQNKSNIDTSITLTRKPALDVCSRILHQIWIQRRQFEFNLPPKYLYLNPGDVVNLPIRGGSQPVQIQEKQLGANYLLAIKANAYEGASLVGSVSTTETELNSGTTTRKTTISNSTFGGSANLTVLDINLLASTDPESGLYVACEAPSTAWNGGSLYYSESAGASYQKAIDLTRESVIGTCDTVLADAATDAVDSVSTLRVTLAAGTLESIPLADFNAFLQFALVGDEIVAFQNATLVSGTTYDLDTFWRGLKGTEYFADGHGSGERFVLLKGADAYIPRLPVPTDKIGTTLYFKLVSPGQDLADVTAVTLTYQANSLKPYAPIGIEGQEDPDGNLLISWTGRNRIGGVRLGEEAESYEVDIINSSGTGAGTVLRTLTTTSQNVIYTDADRTTDALGTNFDVAVYKISSLTGRGYTGEAYPLTFGTALADNVFAGQAVGNVITYPESQGTEPLTWDGLTEATSTTDTDTLLIRTATGVQKIKSSVVGGGGKALFTTVTTSRSLQDSDLNHIIEVDSTSDITLTLDSTALTTPDGFQCVVIRKNTGRVILATAQTLEAEGTEIEGTDRACTISYKGSLTWIALGSLKALDLSGYMLKSVYDYDNDGVVDLPPYAIHETKTLGFTAVDADHGKTFRMNVSADATITLPDNLTKDINFLVYLDAAFVITFAVSGTATKKAVTGTLNEVGRAVAISYDVATTTYYLVGALS